MPILTLSQMTELKTAETGSIMPSIPASDVEQEGECGSQKDGEYQYDCEAEGPVEVQIEIPQRMDEVHRDAPDQHRSADQL